MDTMAVGAARGIFTGLKRMSIANGGEGGRIVNTASVAGLFVSISKINLMNSQSHDEKPLGE